MSKRQCEVDCGPQTNNVTNMYSPKKRNNLVCSRSFRDAKEVEVPSDGPTKIKRPVTICLSQCNKAKMSPSISPSLMSICGKISPSASNDGPSRIDDFIYLGNQLDACSESIKNNGITHVLNVTTHLPKCPVVSESNFLRVSVNDGPYDQLLPHFNEVFQFIDETVESGGRVLVHCMAGVSRSATLVIAYLMHRDKLSFNEAYRFVKQKRPTVAPNFNFLGQLMEFETYLHLQIRSQETNSTMTAQILTLTPTSNHYALGSSPIDGPETLKNGPREMTSSRLQPQEEVDNLSFKCLQDAQTKLELRLSPSEEFLLNDLRHRCRTSSINQSAGSPSSIGSHESSEIVQVS